MSPEGACQTDFDRNLHFEMARAFGQKTTLRLANRAGIVAIKNGKSGNGDPARHSSGARLVAAQLH